MKLFKLPTCKEVYEHNHDYVQGRHLSLKDKLLDKVHLFVCKNCQRLEGALKSVEERMIDSIKNRQQKLNLDRVEQLKNSIKKKL